MDSKTNRVLAAIYSHWEVYGLPPDLNWIREEADISSKSVVSYILRELQEDGYIQLGPTASGTTKVKEPERKGDDKGDTCSCPEGISTPL